MFISHLPDSTYRIQFNAAFTFRDATRLIPYLSSLGITHLYASPYLKARAGSTHGYDVIDHCKLNPELGSEDDFNAMLAVLAKHEMSHIVDVVPNHVGIATNDNVWWNDVLANGPDSRYGRFFDIAWDGSPRPELKGKVLLPLLGDSYAEALEKGELTLSYDCGFWINYFERRFPISPTALSLSSKQTPDVFLKRFNGKPGDARSFDTLHELLEHQFYRLASWRTASDEINYRRFFDVNDLAALAMERQEVFEQTHTLIFELIKSGKVAGLRLDHPDGLYDPGTYFERLQAKVGGKKGEKPLYLLAEKILAVGEPLPKEWLIHGTSGYDFLNQVNGLFVDSDNEQAFSDIYADWLVVGQYSHDVQSFHDLAYAKKKVVLERLLASELHMLAHRLDRLAQQYRGWRDFTLSALIIALKEVISCFSIYRTYIDSADVSKRDQQAVTRAIEEAILRNPSIHAPIFRFIEDVLLQRYPETFGDAERASQLAFTGKFQQLTSPTTAKGIEDTTFYIYNRFVALNEVGGEPSQFGVTSVALHDSMSERQREWPHAMSTLSTHDTKRSEDVRARLNVLSEMPDEWRTSVNRWRELNAPHKTVVEGQKAPDANDEYFIYQTLLGAWPLEPWSNEEYLALGERLQAYLLKAIRETKIHTIWTQPNKPYEDAVANFLTRLLDRSTGGAFLDDFAVLRKRLSKLGLFNGLSQTVLKLTLPGVPDTYQGTELWDFSLVDPDNRRPVDFPRRMSELESLQRAPSQHAEIARNAMQTLEDGRAKLLVHRALLNARRKHPGLFTTGTYTPVEVIGEKSQHAFAFLRKGKRATALVAVPRLIAGLVNDENLSPSDPRVWGNTHIKLPAGCIVGKDLFTGVSPDGRGSIQASQLFEHFPVSVLLAE